MCKQLDIPEIHFTGAECELCHRAERVDTPHNDFYLDRNPTNDIPENIARVCFCCYDHLLLAMPNGIKESVTLFAFLINRGAYTKEQITLAKSELKH